MEGRGTPSARGRRVVNDSTAQGSAIVRRIEALRTRLGPLRYLDAVLVAALAAGFHFYWNVPDKVVAVPGDQGVPKPKDTRRGRTRHTPRPADELAKLHDRFRNRAFAREPKDDAFARYATPRLRRVVASARARAFAGAPAPSPLRTVDFECRTVRCRFRIERAAGPHEIDLFVDELRRIEKDGAPIFRDVRVEPVVSNGTEGSSAWVEVTLARDDLDVRVGAPAARRLPKKVPTLDRDAAAPPSKAEGGTPGRDGA